MATREVLERNGCLENPKQPFFIYGRGERIRTSDLTVPNRALYQAEPRPD